MGGKTFCRDLNVSIHYQLLEREVTEIDVVCYGPVTSSTDGVSGCSKPGREVVVRGMVSASGSSGNTTPNDLRGIPRVPRLEADHSLAPFNVGGSSRLPFENCG